MTTPDTTPGDRDAPAKPANTPHAPNDARPTGRWTVTGRPRGITPVTVALIIGATTNLAALATLITIVFDGPLWLVIVFTAATVALTVPARHTIRAIPGNHFPAT